MTSGVNAMPLGRRQAPVEEEETKVSVWVTHSDCSKIIGRQGRTLREIEARARAKLNVQREDEKDPGSKERCVEIIGSREEQKTALKMLLDLATFCRDAAGVVLKDERRPDENPQDAPDPPLILQIPPEDVGRVLGHKGETVKRLEKESITKIEVDKATGRLEIYGRIEAQDKCVELLLPEVTGATGQDGTVLKEAPPKPEGKADDNAAPKIPPMKIFVKDREAGRVIGHGGETVKDFMEKTGTDIKVQKSKEMKHGGTQRKVEIFGTLEQQEEVVQLILGEVTWCKGPDGILKESVEDAKRREDDEKRREANSLALVKPDRQVEKRRRGGDVDEKKGGVWVCSTCGGDHRTKDCPHSMGLWGIGLQMGMQMGMQGMGSPGMPGMPPGMPGMPGMPPGMPGMMGMMGMPGMPGMMPPPPPPPRRRRRARERSPSSGGSSAEGSGSGASVAEGGGSDDQSGADADAASHSAGEDDAEPAVAARDRGPRMLVKGERESVSRSPPLARPVAPAARDRKDRINVGDL